MNTNTHADLDLDNICRISCCRFKTPPNVPCIRLCCERDNVEWSFKKTTGTADFPRKAMAGLITQLICSSLVYSDNALHPSACIGVCLRSDWSWRVDVAYPADDHFEAGDLNHLRT